MADNQSFLLYRNILLPEMEASINRTIFLLITAFLVLWFPYHLYRLIAVSIFEGTFFVAAKDYLKSVYPL